MGEVSEELEKQINEVFSYHPATLEQIPRYEKIREAARVLAHVIFENCPLSADRTTAVRKVREAVMTANASIALEHVELI